MNSISDQIVAAIVLALGPAAGVEGRVFRSRELAIVRGETPCIVVLLGVESTEAFSDDVDDNRLMVDLEVTVRGDPFDQLVDPVAVDVHRILCTDAGLRAIVTAVRRKERAWAAEEADSTAGCLTMKYELRYLSAANDMTMLV